MADSKITALPQLDATPADGDELVIVNQDGGAGSVPQTQRISVQNLLSGVGSALTVTDGVNPVSDVSQITVAGSITLTDNTGGLVTISATDTDTNTTYTITTADSGDDAIIRLNDGSTNDDITIAAGSGVTIDHTTDTITINAETAAGTTINNNADNRLITGSGTANTLEGEANLTYDGQLLDIKNDGTDQSEIRLYCETSNAHYVGIAGSPHAGAASHVLQLPLQPGTAGQVLSIDSVDGSTQQLIFSDAASATSLDGQKLEYVVSDTALDSAGDFEGLVMKVGDAGNTLTAGTVYYYDATQSDWVAASNAAEGTAKGVLGIALGASGTADGVLIQGVYYYADAAGAAGDVLYLGASGALTETAPTTDGQILRVLGQNIDDNVVMFQPSQDFVELGAAAATTGIDDLSDVDTTTVAPTNGQALVWDSAASQWEPGTVSGGSSDLDGLSDVTITGTPTVGQVLIYDATSSVFENNTLTSGGYTKITNGDGAITITTGQGAELDFRYESSAVSTAGNAEGTVVKFGTGTLVAGQVYTHASGAWVAVDADAQATTEGLLGMALGTSPTTNGLLVHGVGYLSHDPGDAGDVLYVHTTAGELSATQPSATGDFVRVAGYCLADNKVFFSPSQDFIEIG